MSELENACEVITGLENQVYANEQTITDLEQDVNNKNDEIDELKAALENITDAVENITCNLDVEIREARKMV
jgi:uncharacterized protein YoxC